MLSHSTWPHLCGSSGVFVAANEKFGWSTLPKARATESSWASDLRVSPCALAISTTANACLSQTDVWRAPGVSFLLGILAVLAVQTVGKSIELEADRYFDGNGGLPAGLGGSRGQPVFRFTERPESVALQAWIDEAEIQAVELWAERGLAPLGDEPEPAGEPALALSSAAPPGGARVPSDAWSGWCCVVGEGDVKGGMVFVAVGQYGLYDMGRTGASAVLLQLARQPARRCGPSWRSRPRLCQAGPDGLPDATCTGRGREDLGDHARHGWPSCRTLRSVSEAVDRCEFEDWALAEPRTTLYVISEIAKQSGGPVQRHTTWKHENKLNDDEHSAVAHEMLSDILELACAYDQVDVSNLASMEAQARHKQFVEHKIKKKKKETVKDFDSQDCFLVTNGSEAGEWPTPAAATRPLERIMPRDLLSLPAAPARPAMGGALVAAPLRPEAALVELFGSGSLGYGPDGPTAAAPCDRGLVSRPESAGRESLLEVLPEPDRSSWAPATRLASTAAVVGLEAEDGDQLEFSIQDIADCFCQFRAPDYTAPRFGARPPRARELSAEAAEGQMLVDGARVYPFSRAARWTKQAIRELLRRGGFGGVERELAGRQLAPSVGSELVPQIARVDNEVFVSSQAGATRARVERLPWWRPRSACRCARFWSGGQAPLRRRRASGGEVEKMVGHFARAMPLNRTAPRVPRGLRFREEVAAGAACAGPLGRAEAGQASSIGQWGATRARRWTAGLAILEMWIAARKMMLDHGKRLALFGGFRRTLGPEIADYAKPEEAARLAADTYLRLNRLQAQRANQAAPALPEAGGDYRAAPAVLMSEEGPRTAEISAIAPILLGSPSRLILGQAARQAKPMERLFWRTGAAFNVALKNAAALETPAGRELAPHVARHLKPLHDQLAMDDPRVCSSFLPTPINGSRSR
ncbi:unnamed protein product [Prorocentrum cordatum]|uniref:Uncharacterized protein n=1 Tax=Prorocentrum cordatum TaxID=2364126 RepID=A0ABN9PSN9_9DINO|nr:unnamed protein product [Polarella glacialis]